VSVVDFMKLYWRKWYGDFFWVKRTMSRFRPLSGNCSHYGTWHMPSTT